MPEIGALQTDLYRRRVRSRQPSVLTISLCFNAVFMLYFVLSHFLNHPELVDSSGAHGEERAWHGGHPADVHRGSCWCGAEDRYCMCTPSLAIDLVVSSGKNHEYLWLVRRRDTNQLATMGGFVIVGETAEDCVRRELKEEMGIDLRDDPVLQGVYSDPRRDNRRNTASAVYYVHLADDLHPRAGDDAKEVMRISIDSIEDHEYFADHRTILMDFRRLIRSEQPDKSTHGDFAQDISRSLCLPR